MTGAPSRFSVKTMTSFEVCTKDGDNGGDGATEDRRLRSAERQGGDCGGARVQEALGVVFGAPLISSISPSLRHGI